MIFILRYTCVWLLEICLKNKTIWLTASEKIILYKVMFFYVPSEIIMFVIKYVYSEYTYITHLSICI